MHSGSVASFEKNVDRLASAVFAAACGYALYAFLAGRLGQATLAIESVAAVTIGYVLSDRALNRIKPRPRRLPVPIFDVREVGPIEEPELLLTEIFEPQPVAQPADALILDDILAKLSSDSRVVRLFDPSAMPKAGELRSRIDRHLAVETVAQTPDATQALHDALAELRRAIH